MIAYLIPVLIGWFSGIIVNYLSDVLPFRRKFVQPFCLACQKNQTWLNYFFWPRRCPNCGKLRSYRIFVVEAIFILASVWLWNSPPDELGYLPGLMLLVFFGVVTVIDIEYRLILHPVSLIGGVLGLIIGVWLHGPIVTILGGIAGFLIMLGLYYLGFLFLRIMTRLRGDEVDEVALGFGDVNLSGIIGLLLGWPGILAGLFLAIVLAGGASLIYLILMLIVRKYKPSLVLPYGPFLVASAILLLYLKELFV